MLPLDQTIEITLAKEHGGSGGFGNALEEFLRKKT